MTNYSYIGSELELFCNASNWKSYYSHLIQNHLGSEILEVGAGIGTTTKFLCKGKQKRWICLEPDPSLASILQASISSRHLPECCEMRTSTLSELKCSETFDTIIYIDVLEHITDDKAEVSFAVEHLRDGGTLVVLAPAHQWLFTPFDRAIGHYRRYNKSTLLSIIPTNLELISLMYLDSFGLIASLGNRFILNSKMPSKRQIAIWDKMMIPVSRILDPLLQYSVGKSILGVWQKRLK